MSLDNQEFREIYRSLNIPVHLTPPWMDAVCIKGGWDVILSKNKNGKVNALLVYHYRMLAGFRFILSPPHCFYNGLCILDSPRDRNYKTLTDYDKVIKSLFKRLPPFSFYYQQMHPSVKDWLPLYHLGFNQSTRYTYVIDRSSGNEHIWHNMKPSLKRNINRSVESQIIESVSFEEFWMAIEQSYKTRKNPFIKQLLKALHNNLNQESACGIHLSKCKDTGKVTAGIMLVWDKDTCYYTCGFYNPEMKTLNGISVLLWHFIKNNNKRYFDFEGSMIEPIDYFFASFGGQRIAHHRIWKINNPLLSPAIKFKFKDILGNS